MRKTKKLEMRNEKLEMIITFISKLLSLSFLIYLNFLTI